MSGNDALERHDKMQKLNRSLTFDEPGFEPHHENHGFANTALIAIGIVFGLFISTVIGHADRAAEQKDCQQCHSMTDHAKMTRYFEPTSPVPAQMATAVMMTPRPRLMAAIAKVETGGDPTKRNTGYKKRHSGAFQVNPKHWGKVPNDPIQQAIQAESILSELTDTMPIKKALSVYGGDSTSKYQRRVLAELQRVP